MILKNPKDKGGDIEIVHEGLKWSIKKGEVFAFDDNVGRFLLSRYPFLEKKQGSVDNSDEPEVLKKEDKFVCSNCGFESDKRIAVVGHMNKYKKDKDSKDKEKVKKAKPIEKVNPNPTLAEARAQGRYAGTDEYADKDIPQGGTDRDGVEWYGEGYSEYKRRPRVPGKRPPGNFGAY